jgi:hypothetical protein
LRRVPCIEVGLGLQLPLRCRSKGGRQGRPQVERTGWPGGATHGPLWRRSASLRAPRPPWPHRRRELLQREAVQRRRAGGSGLSRSSGSFVVAVVGGAGIAGFRGGGCGGRGSGARRILGDLALGQAVRRLSTTGLEEIARRILGRFLIFECTEGADGDRGFCFLLSFPFPCWQRGERDRRGRASRLHQA